MAPVSSLPLRKDVPVEYTWNKESVFATLDDFETELKAVLADLPTVVGCSEKLSDSPAALVEALQARDALILRAYKLYMYAAISAEVEKSNPTAVALPGKAQAVMGQCLGGLAFIEPECLAIGHEKLTAWMETTPALEIYRHYFDDLFRRQAHVRSAEVEEILGMLAEPFSNIENTTGLLTDADFQFAPAHTSQGEEQPVGQSSFTGYMSSPDRQLRRSAWTSFMDEYLAHKNVLAGNLGTSIKANVFTARVRRHPDTLEASLFENNIPVQVFTNLLDTFQKNLPTWRRYFDIRRKALGVDKLEPFDMWAPLTGERPKVTYPQAVEWIAQGLAPLGEEYTGILRRGCLEERWVDIYPNQGKISGAFSFGVKGTHPFIVMSYADEIFSLSTLAHELGHSMHSYMTWRNQPVIYSNYSLFVAETASNFHQAMVRAHLLNTQSDPAFQIAVIEEAMANFYRYFLIMPTLARFELDLHQRVERGEGFNADQAIDLMADLFTEAFGDAVLIDRPRVGMTWATFSHLFADYYVYQYATGISAANALSQRVLSGAPNAAQDYLRFLKSGSSLYPLDALKVAGVDLSTPEPVEATFAILSGLVDRLEKLI